MKYNITKVKDKFPKRAARSERTKKKMHLDNYAETIIDVYIPLMVDTTEIYNNLFDRLLDALYDNNKGFETLGMYGGNFTLIASYSTSEFTEQVAIDYVNDVMRIITEVEPSFAEVNEVTINHGDAWYGEW